MTARELAEQFRVALETVDGRATLCASVAEAQDRIVELCADRTVVIDERNEDTAGLANRLRVVGDPWDAAVGVTGVVAAVAETGSLALAWGPGRRRSTPLVPPEHIALVPLSRLVATYADVIDLLAGLDPAPTGMQVITGPSRSGDIESKLVKGVHGPGQVRAFLYPD